MSRDKAERILRMIDTANASAWDPATIESWVHPQARAYPARDFPGPDVYVGREDVMGFVREWSSTFDDLRWDVDQLLDLDETVLVLARMVGTSGTTGAAVDWPFGGIFGDWRDGMFAEVRFFMDHEEARRAAGIDREAGSTPP
jgi:hypothetical protein